MPKDDWAKAKAKDVAKSIRPKRHACNRMRNPEHVAKRHSSNSILWFGKHKNSSIASIQETDPNWLHWLSEQPTEDQDWRFAGLVLFVRNHIRHRVGSDKGIIHRPKRPSRYTLNSPKDGSVRQTEGVCKSICPF